MPSASESIVLGVVSGILTTVVLFLMNRVFLRVFLPWYQALVYRGVVIDGEWHGETENNQGTTHVFVTRIEQHAHQVSGDMKVVTAKPDTADVVTEFQLSGELWEGFLLLSLRSRDQTQLSFAAVLLKVQKGGRQLSGKMSFRNLSNDDIRSIDILLERK